MVLTRYFWRCIHPPPPPLEMPSGMEGGENGLSSYQMETSPAGGFPTTATTRTDEQEPPVGSEEVEFGNEEECRHQLLEMAGTMATGVPQALVKVAAISVSLSGASGEMITATGQRQEGEGEMLPNSEMKQK